MIFLKEIKVYKYIFSTMDKCEYCESDGVELSVRVQTLSKLRKNIALLEKDVHICSECFNEEKCPDCNFVTGGDICVYCRYSEHY